MNIKSNRLKKIFGGYTLVELLVVASIISLLSSIILVALTTSKARAQDAQKIADLDSVKSAIVTYKIDHKDKAPVPAGCSGGCIASADGSYLIYDTDPGNPFNATLKPALVDNKYLADLPAKPIGLFYYYKPGTTEDIVVIGSTLVTPQPSINGAPNTCRPFTEVAVGSFQNPPLSAQLTYTMSPPVLHAGEHGYFAIQTSGPPVISYDVSATQCNDGIDNNGGGLIDSADPGCVPGPAGATAIDDNGEFTTAPSGPALCSNTSPNSDYCLCVYNY